MFDCSNVHDDPKDPSRCAREFHACGVWVGYLAPDKQDVSYRGLPSFQELKRNRSSQVLPHPQVDLMGTSVEDCEAGCRSCIGGEAVPAKLNMICYVKGINLPILPLDGEHEANELFCILIPQSSDRPMKGIQAFRPYEVRNAGDGKSFDNNFMLLGIDNRSMGTDTSALVQSFLTSQELQETATRPKRVPRASQNNVSVERQFMSDWMGKSQQTLTRQDNPQAKDGEHDKEDRQYAEAALSHSILSWGISTPAHKMEIRGESQQTRRPKEKLRQLPMEDFSLISVLFRPLPARLSQTMKLIASTSCAS